MNACGRFLQSSLPYRAWPAAAAAAAFFPEAGSRSWPRRLECSSVAIAAASQPSADRADGVNSALVKDRATTESPDLDSGDYAAEGCGLVSRLGDAVFGCQSGGVLA